MTRALEGMTVEQLVDEFVKVCLAQSLALLDEDVSRLNGLVDEMRLIVEALKYRPGDQRTALLALYEHPNSQVRLKAAKNSLAVAPVEAMKALQAIADSQEYPQAGEAGMSLWNLDRGIYRPT